MGWWVTQAAGGTVASGLQAGTVTPSQPTGSLSPGPAGGPRLEAALEGHSRLLGGHCRQWTP